MTVKERLEAVLNAEAAAIAAVKVSVKHEWAVERLAECKGKVVTMGMGKAGLMARKMAATLCATGTPAVFLHPGEAAHGDLGVITGLDVVVAFSHSGQTEEVLEALKSAHRIARPYVIGISAHAQRPFTEVCDVVLEMGAIEEPCPLGLTPSASSAVMLAIGDALALAVLEVKGMTREGFGIRHRGGYLGKSVQA